MTRLQQKTDEELMVLIHAHNHEAFSELVTRHSERFYALSYRTLFNQSDAEDIVQEAFLKLWKTPTMWRVDKDSKFTTWFYRIIVNACYDLNKKKSSQTFSLSESNDEYKVHEPVTEDVFEQDDESSQLSAIENALQQLPERQRTALNLCFYEELSNKEAAGIMGLRLKALQSLIMRAKTTLKAHFKIAEDGEHE